MWYYKDDISAPEADMDELDMEEDDSQERMYDEPGTMPNLMYVVGPDKLLTKVFRFLPKSIQNLLNIDYIHVTIQITQLFSTKYRNYFASRNRTNSTSIVFGLHCRYIFFLSQSYLSHSFCRRNSTNPC